MNAFERLARWIAGELRIDPDTLTPSTRLRDLGGDSVMAVELTMAIEEAELEVDDADELTIDGWFGTTLGELAERIRWPELP